MGFLDALKAAFTTTYRSTGANEVGIATPFYTDNHLYAITAQDIWPALDLARLAPTRATAMRLGVASRGRQLICGAIGGMPILAYRGSELVNTTGMVLRPEPGRARAVTMAWTVDQMMWHGRAWWAIKERNAWGKPTGVELILEDRIAFDVEKGTISVDGGPPQPQEAFIRIDAMTEGLLATASTSLTRAALVEAAAARAGENPVPSVELHQNGGDPLSQSQIDALVSRWSAARRGANGGVAFTSQSIEVKTHGQAAEQLLIDSRNASALDIARHMNLPAWAIDAAVSGTSLTYSNVPSRSRELIDYTLQPYMDAIAGRLSMDDVSPVGTWYRIDPSRLLRGDFNDRMTAGKTAVEADIYTVDEIRKMENETPLESTS